MRLTFWHKCWCDIIDTGTGTWTCTGAGVQPLDSSVHLGFWGRGGAAGAGRARATRWGDRPSGSSGERRRRADRTMLVAVSPLLKRPMIALERASFMRRTEMTTPTHTVSCCHRLSRRRSVPLKLLASSARGVEPCSRGVLSTWPAAVARQVLPWRRGGMSEA